MPVADNVSRGFFCALSIDQPAWVNLILDKGVILASLRSTNRFDAALSIASERPKLKAP